MKLAEGDVLDDAMQLMLKHSWQCNRPVLSIDQLAELIPVLAPLYRESRPRVQAKRKSQKLPSRPVRGSSSEVPDEIRDAVLDRDGHACNRCGVPVQRPYYSLQHRRPRGMGGSRLLHTMANLVTLCGSASTRCHGEVENDRDTSTRLGWLVPHGVTPEEWPVWRWTPDGHRWEQPGKSWELSSPHERQSDLGGVA